MLMLFAAAFAVPASSASAEGGRGPGGEEVKLPAYAEVASRVRGAAQPPPRNVFDLARKAYRCGLSHGHFERPYLSVIDYSRPSHERRLWVIDMRNGDVLFHEYVAHGRNTGLNEARSFSNVMGSKQSSLGLFRTAETYRGQHGYSLNLEGLERGVNDLAYDRRIVMHGAEYVGEAFVKRHGRIGRSWGCPAVDTAVNRPIIDTIKGGSAVFAYYPDLDWLDGSTFLDCDGIAASGPDGAGDAPTSRR